MREHSQMVLYQSILPVLHQPGCPFCRLLKDFQTDRLQKHVQGELHQDAPAAARIFLDHVNEAVPLSNGCPSRLVPLRRR